VAHTRFYEDPDFLRVQQLYVAVAAALLLAFAFFPVAHLTNHRGGETTLFEVPIISVFGSGGYQVVTQALGREYPALGWLQGALVLLFSGGCLAALALYRQRRIQIRLVLGLAIGFMLVPVIGYLNAHTLRETKNLTQLAIEAGWGLNLPIGGALLLLLAQRAIRKDEATVRRAERFW
jgi:hypothetical protein